MDRNYALLSADAPSRGTEIATSGLRALILNGVDRNTIQDALRGHGRPSADRSDGYIFFGSVRPPSFRAFSSTGMAAPEALWHVLSAVATAVAGSVSK